VCLDESTRLWRFRFAHTFQKYFVKAKEYVFRFYIASCIHSGMGEFSNLSRILPTTLMLRWGYVNTEKVLYCVYKIFLKSTRESKSSQPCLHFFSDRLRNNAGAYNMYGLLLEHQKLFLQAEKAFERLHELLQLQHEIIVWISVCNPCFQYWSCLCFIFWSAIKLLQESDTESQQQHLNSVLVNQARVLW